jgi:hypothetical protein
MRLIGTGLLAGAAIASAVPFLAVAHSSSQSDAHTSSDVSQPSAAAQAYLDQAINLIRQHHINSATADWPAITATAHARIAHASATADTYPAIREIFAALHERHSFLIEPRAAVPAWRGTAGARGNDMTAPEPTSRLIDGRYALVQLPQLDTLGTGGEAVGRAYAASVRAALERMDRAPLCGWLIDLRGNGGGNMWPMLQGLDPLLGDPPFGYFLIRNGTGLPWTRANGLIRPAPALQAGSTPSFTLVHQAAPVAILIGGSTASSGEMAAIALIGRTRVRTFGAPSAGLTTANEPHPLPDGAQLLITVTTVRDRLHRDYSGPITPDEQVAPAQAEQAATRWLAAQCGRPARPRLR